MQGSDNGKSTTQTVLARLARVEWELRLWRYGLAAVVLVFVATAGSPDRQSNEIVAKKITVTGDQGQPLITLGSWGQGSGGLILVNSMAGSESAVESLHRDLDLRKELGKKWGAAIVGLPSSAAIYLSEQECRLRRYWPDENRANQHRLWNSRRPRRGALGTRPV
jgi:hypothetical protein